MRSVGGYRIQELLGQGAQGVVYRAQGPQGQGVALKLLLTPDPDPRFWQEAQAAGRLSHPHIVAAREYGRADDGREFIAMELVEGESLRERIRREGGLAPQDAVDLMLQLCDALAYAHEQGVLHRDIKPQNVIVTPEGVAKLTDFGLGKVVDQGESLTRTGEVLGTPAYMPPEQALGDRQRVGPAADLYSLGATLFVMLTGRLPFEATSPLVMLHALLHAPPRPPSELRPGVPAWLDAVCLRCLEKDPADRYPDARALAAALRPAPAPQRRRAPARTLAALLLASALALCAWTWWRPPPAGPPRAVKAHERGQRLAELDDWEGSLEAFELAVALAPEFAQAHCDRGAVLAQLDRLEDGLRALDRALELDPTLGEAYRVRAEIRLDQEDPQAALRDLARAAQLTPDDPLVALHEGLCHHQTGADQAAADAYTQALALDPELMEAYTNRGASRYRLGDLAGAEADFTRALRFEPGNPFALFNRAVVRADRGNLTSALEDMRQAAALQPESYTAQGMLGQFLWQLGQYEEARDPLRRALRLDPTPDDARRLQSQLDACDARLRR